MEKNIVLYAMIPEQVKVERRGQNHASYNSKQKALAHNRKNTVQVAQAIKNAKPHSVNDLVGKMQHYGVLPTRVDVVKSSAPVVIKAIKKGANPRQAVQALRTQSAIDYATCSQLLSVASPADKAIINQMKNSALSSSLLKQIKQKTLERLVFAKSGNIQESQKLLLGIAKLESEFLSIVSKQGAKLQNKSLVGCLLTMAKKESELEFESSMGSDTKTEDEKVATGEKTPEQTVKDEETATLLENSAEQNLDQQADLVALTDSDLAVESPMANIFSTKNMLIFSALAVGVYLYRRNK